MPLIKQIEENSCQIAVWEIKESITELVKLSNNINIPEFKSDRRKKEFLSARILLHKIMPQAQIYYNKYGAPEIDDSKFIAISHSKKLTAIIISSKKVGLDIEEITETAQKISSKFISKENLPKLSKEIATLIWSCKEAIFKWHQKGSINFVDDIKIKRTVIKEKGIITANFKNDIYTLHYKKLNAHFLVYVCK